MVAKLRTAQFKDALLAFLRAELDSPTERPRLLQALKSRNETESVVSNDTSVACLHELFKDYRGHEQVFDGLNLTACEYHWVELNEADIRDQVVTCRNHFEDRFNTRVLADVCEKWQVETEWIIQKRDSLEASILVTDTAFEKFVILEGHNRLIAYYANKDRLKFPITVIVGVSEHASKWSQW